MSEVVLKQPNGRQSKIGVDRSPTGGIDLVFMRSSVGEMLVRLTLQQALELANAIIEEASERFGDHVTGGDEKEIAP